jgi:hypothetical protein
MEPIPANATGAWCTIKYHDEDNTLSPVFFSFGEYDEDKDMVYDSLGHRDDLVFFYTSPEELPDLMTDWGQDFQVLSIDGYEVEVNA